MQMCYIDFTYECCKLCYLHLSKTVSRQYIQYKNNNVQSLIVRIHKH